METAECVARKWGNSVGVVLPQSVLEKEGIKPGKRIIISVRSRPDFEKLFGSVQFKESAQQIKDEMRRGW